MMLLSKLALSWESADEDITTRVGEILTSWDGTPYMPGCQGKGRGVDCVRFVAGVLDELSGTTTPIKALPQDAAVHAPDVALSAESALVNLFAPTTVVEDSVLQPGDILVIGFTGGGPGHCMIVGHKRNTLWHSDYRAGVHQSGFGLFAMYQRLHCIYRLSNIKDRWQT